MSSKFKQLKQAGVSPAAVRSSIPQVDAGEPKEAVVGPDAVQAGAMPAEVTATTQQPHGEPTVNDDPRSTPVDTSQRTIPLGTHIYPDRQKQLRYEAFMLDVKVWEVVETALDDYFKRRYGKPKKPQ